MASLFTEDFEGGTGGAAVTTSNTSFAAVGSGATFLAGPLGGSSGGFGTSPFGTSPFGTGGGSGSMAAQIVVTNATSTFTVNYSGAKQVLYRRFYMQLPALPTAVFTFAQMRGGGATHAGLRVQPTGALSVTNAGPTILTSPAGTIPAGQWMRVEWRLDLPAGEQQVRIFYGANLHGTTADYDTGVRAFTAGSIEQSTIGVATSQASQVTIQFDSVADDDATWLGPFAAPTTSGLSVALSGTGTLSASLTSTAGSIAVALSGAGTLSASLYAVPEAPPTESQLQHEWVMFARGFDYAPTVALPIISAQMVLRHMGVGKAVAQTSHTEDRWAALGPGNGITVWRDGVQQFTGLVSKRQLVWDAESARALIHVECEGDEVHFADRLVFPDPLRPADDQTVSDRWSFTGRASTAMLRLISDQAGATARADRRVSGLVLGADPALGPNRKWSALFNSEENALGSLAAIAIGSSANLGLRMTAGPGFLRADVTAPRDLSSSAVFSADLSNLVGFDYSEAAPTVTHALAAGAGDLKARLRRLVATNEASSLQWRRQRWSYVDQRDTGLTSDLDLAAADALADGGQTVEVSVTLADSDAATYGPDWGLGDRITIYVGLPGQTKPARVTDVVREILLEVSEDGAETIRPAVGTTDAKAIPMSPQQRQLAAIGSQLSNLIARK